VSPKLILQQGFPASPVPVQQHATPAKLAPAHDVQVVSNISQVNLTQATPLSDFLQQHPWMAKVIGNVFSQTEAYQMCTLLNHGRLLVWDTNYCCGAYTNCSCPVRVAVLRLATVQSVSD
jgi:hypothetical protein